MTGTMEQIPMLYTAEDFALTLKIKVTSLRRSVARGSLPKPDGHLGRTPYWHYNTVDAVLAKRSKL
jgi:hypothetical protein